MFRQLFSSHTFRFMSGYVAGLSVAVFVVLVAIYAATSYSYFSAVHDSIQSQLEALARAHEEGGVAAAEEYVRQRTEPGLANRFFFLVVDERQRRLAGNLEHWPRTSEHLAGWLSFELDSLRRGEEEALAAEFIARSLVLDSGDQVLVARHADDLILSGKLVAGALVRSMVATIVLGTLGGLIIAGLSGRRIHAINRSLRRIMSGDLSERIDAGPAGGDFRDLVGNLNRMLDRIEALMAGLTQVSDNIAHDLRTPLTRLRNHLAELQGQVEAPQAETVRQLLEEADGLLATFNALLRIAQVESGNRRAGFDSVVLSVLLADVVELYEPLAADRGIALSAALPPGEVVVLGDRDLLFQAYANLLDNAIKFTPAGGRVNLALEVCDGAVRVFIRDSGCGIPEQERDRVFDRFYRVEGSRRRGAGNGLGLSLVQAVIHLHGGALKLGDNRPGLQVETVLPQGG